MFQILKHLLAGRKSICSIFHIINQKKKNLCTQIRENSWSRRETWLLLRVFSHDSSDPPGSFHTNNSVFVGDFHPSMAFLFLWLCGLVGDLARVQTVKRIPAFAKRLCTVPSPGLLHLSCECEAGEQSGKGSLIRGRCLSYWEQLSQCRLPAPRGHASFSMVTLPLLSSCYWSNMLDVDAKRNRLLKVIILKM